MPSRYSQPPTPILTNYTLSEIINLHPDEDHSCAGYATSKRRGCLLSTNAQGRKIAMSLLNQGTKDLCAGRCIDGLLEDLAPYVLCRRWHQDQAPALAAIWQGRVRRFLDSSGSWQRRTPSAGSTTRQSGPVPVPVDVDVEAQSTWLTRRLQHCIQEREQERRRNAPIQSTGTDINNGRATANPDPVRRHAGSSERQTTSSTTSSSCSGSATRRRPVEGDCTICCSPLRETCSGSGDDATGVDNDTKKEETEGQNLSWCKAQCGVSYHTKCIKRWLDLKASQTCPTCRSIWKN